MNVRYQTQIPASCDRGDTYGAGRMPKILRFRIDWNGEHVTEDGRYYIQNEESLNMGREPRHYPGATEFGSASWRGSVNLPACLATASAPDNHEADRRSLILNHNNSE